MIDLGDFADRLDQLADADIPVQAVEALIELWAEVSRDAVKSGSMRAWDTGFLHDHIETVGAQASGSGAVGEIESQANYSGFVNGGTRYMAARPFFDQGMLAAEQAAGELEMRIGSSVESLLGSGGMARPIGYIHR